MLVHFPIALLLAGVVFDLHAWWGIAELSSKFRGLLTAGLLTGILAALPGFLNFLTVPVHTEEAHLLMYWHLGVQSAALVVFAWSAWAMRRRPVADPHRRAGGLLCGCRLPDLTGRASGDMSSTAT